MLKTRLAAFLMGLCGCIPLVSGQEPTVSLTESVLAAPVAPMPYINPLYLNQWVALDANGSVSGKLVGLDETGAVGPRPAVEVFLLRHGQTVSNVITDNDGKFQFGNLNPGTYSFVAQSDFTFAAFGFHVLPTGSAPTSEFEVYASNLPSARARELLNENWVPASGSNSYTVFETDPVQPNRRFGVSARVRLQNGNLVGQVSRPGVPLAEQDLTGNVAHVLQAGKSVAAVPVARDGTFVVKSLPVGVYDLFVVGEDGTAAIGFEAIETKPMAANASAVSPRLVAFQDASDTLNVELADTTDIAPAVEEVPPPEYVEEGVPFAGGGFGGGGGGLGGGGGIGGGGLGGLLGIAGLAAGIAALSSNDEFNPNFASPIQ